MLNNISQIAINNGGSLTPLIIPSELTDGTGLCNVSLFMDGEELIANIRHVHYTLYHSEGDQKYQTVWEGPLSYYHREDSRVLKTNNFYCILDNDDLSIKKYKLIDTSKLDVEPLWDFIGLEDARLVKWDDKYYLCGVRRDTTTNGQGRMELSEIEINDNFVKEINRNRIEVPDKESYCEKNWMPILDQPYHFVKWTNPTEVIRVNLNDNISEGVYLHDNQQELPYEIRGGTPLIPWNDDQYLCICRRYPYP